MTYPLVEKEMEIGDTRTYSTPSLPDFDVEITRTGENTFSYRIIKVVMAAHEFNSLLNAKEDAQYAFLKLKTLESKIETKKRE